MGTAEGEGTSKQGVAPTNRVMSVDVLRGFDMFWIVGGGAIVGALKAFGDHPVILFLANQLEHREWEGCVFYDLIFPLFVFLVGVSIVFSLGRIAEHGGAWAAHRRIFKRFAIMFLLGIFYYGGIAKGIDGIRLLGVLQRLALCYLFTSLLFCHLNPKQLAVVCAALLLGYWALLSFVPVPGVGVPSFDVEKNWANYIDAQFLPFRRNNGTWDPEGILSTIPAVGSCLLGVFAGLFIKDKRITAEKKGMYLLAAGVALLALGYAWGLQCPVIKKIWTSSYVLVAGGYSCMLLGVFYQVVDVWKIRAWTPPFLWIGSNALAIYMARNLVDFPAIAQRFTGVPADPATAPGRTLALTLVSLALIIALARFLYRRQVFIRI